MRGNAYEERPVKGKGQYDLPPEAVSLGNRDKGSLVFELLYEEQWIVLPVPVGRVREQGASSTSGFVAVSLSLSAHPAACLAGTVQWEPLCFSLLLCPCVCSLQPPEPMGCGKGGGAVDPSTPLRHTLLLTRFFNSYFYFQFLNVIHSALSPVFFSCSAYAICACASVLQPMLYHVRVLASCSPRSPWVAGGEEEEVVQGTPRHRQAGPGTCLPQSPFQVSSRICA